MSKDIAKIIFEKTRYRASAEEIDSLSKNIILLEKRGLDKLNQRLVEGGRGVWDTMTEHNFAVTQALLHSPSTLISYEPEELQRSPDFKIVIGDIIYWVQVKNLSELERVNRRDKLIAKIKKSVSVINVGKFFNCYLSPYFTDNDIASLKEFVENVERKSTEKTSYLFPNTEKPKARIEFWLPGSKKLSCLTLGISGDMGGMQEITGLAEKQIRESLFNASGAFNWDAEDNMVNIIVLQADKYHDTDVCDAIFGTEFEEFKGSKHSWSRDKDGLIQEQDFSKKVSGIVAIKRKNDKPVSSNYAILYVNHKAKHNIDNMKKLMPFDKIVYYNMRTPMGEGNFKLA